ncbi:MAG: tRNA 2-thiocytidine biosynthesis protein TtcA [Thiothrix sp.]|nr:tRNA 2-thiocytidine biosynthesis protein TtcA [Thiothrix sp.]HPQ94356.1 ATP-binding protein [Thiolinea sp.]
MNAILSPVTDAGAGTGVFARPPKTLVRAVGRAIGEFDLIREGDRILLGLSGGKDSLSLLHLLHHFRRQAPVRFEFAAVTIDPQSGAFDPSPLIPYLEQLGVPYHYVREPIMALAETHMDNNSYCAFCSRMKRGLMYRTAREQGYNVLALAQHLDDLAESFLMSAFHGGRLKTMKAHYRIDAGDLRVIRPLVHARERQTADFAHAAGLPVIVENCPACFDMPTQREHMKQLLRREEAANPHAFKSLATALRPLMRDGMDQA